MKLEKYIAVSGMSGLFKLVNTRNNGILIEDFDTNNTKFVSTRKHQFTPLGTIALYTNDDSVELQKVFKSMYELKDEIGLVDLNSNSSELRDYFVKVLPDYDPDRVHISDIKKVIKWYNFLEERGLLVFESDEEE